MNATEILKEIQALSCAETKISDDTKEVLIRSHCLYLLCRSGDPLWKVAAARNGRVLAERCKQCAELFRDLESEGIAYAQIKGAPLAVLAYGNIGMRASTDIDLLVSKDDLSRVKPLLKRNGFIQARLTNNGIVPYSREEIVFYGLTTHQTAPFLKESGNQTDPYLEVDLNTDLFWGEAQAESDLYSILEHTVSMEPVPGYPVAVLAPPYAFASLCMHHYKDMNSLYLLYERNGYDFSQFCDVFYFCVNQLARYPVEPLREIWEELGVLPYVYWMLYYTAQVFRNSTLDGLLHAMENPVGDSLLEQYGLSQDERKCWEISFEERLFLGSFPEYLQMHLSERELEKIKHNLQYL